MKEGFSVNTEVCKAIQNMLDIAHDNGVVLWELIGEIVNEKEQLIYSQTKNSRFGPQITEEEEIRKVLDEFSGAYSILDDYDYKNYRPKNNGTISSQKISYDKCIEIINIMRSSNDSTLFGTERFEGLKSIIADIYQTFDGNDVYKTVEEKAVHFFYFVIKNHVFNDGNKRIATMLLIYFLNFYKILYRNGKKIIDNKTLAMLAIFVAESNANDAEHVMNTVFSVLFEK